MNATESVFRESRPAFFANRVLRLLIKTATAQELGPDVLALLTVIVMTEDARRYRGPVTFWNDQLLPLVGFSKWERLDKARKAAVAAGWLAYEPGGRHRVGIYRVTIPAELQEVEDAAVDEGRYPADGYQAGDQDSPGIPQTDNYTGTEPGTEPESRRGTTGATSRVTTGGTSLPTPKPNPSPVPLPKKDAADAAGVLTKSRNRPSKKPEPIQIPPELDNDAARKALDEFREHRRQMKKPLTAMAESKLLKDWSAKGAGRFVAAVDRSIAQGWQGLFEANTKAEPTGMMDSLNRFAASGGDE